MPSPATEPKPEPSDWREKLNGCIDILNDDREVRRAIVSALLWCRDGIDEAMRRPSCVVCEGTGLRTGHPDSVCPACRGDGERRKSDWRERFDRWAMEHDGDAAAVAMFQALRDGLDEALRLRGAP